MHRIAKITLNESTELAFITPDELKTFTVENADFFALWWKLQCAKLLNPERQDFFVIMHKRITTQMKDVNTGSLVKKISSCFLKGTQVLPFKANEARFAFLTDHKSGKPLPHLASDVFVDFEI